uniref:Uncharacterized protein n=1 Tax=Solibacter usitatus (strain Ellin6076) TaxID=234267 RepID=Q02DC1_SOLUE
MASETCRGTENLKRLRTYLAEAVLAGTSGEIKGYAIGAEAFGKFEHSDPQSDSTVRGQARGLLHLRRHRRSGPDHLLEGAIPGVFRAGRSGSGGGSSRGSRRCGSGGRLPAVCGNRGGGDSVPGAAFALADEVADQPGAVDAGVGAALASAGGQSDSAGAGTEQYGLISMLPGFHAGFVFVVGTGCAEADWAAAEYVTTPKYVRELVATCGCLRASYRRRIRR